MNNSPKIKPIEAIDYPEMIKLPGLDIRAILIRHWLDKNTKEDAYLVGCYVLELENFKASFDESILDLVTPQVWEYLEAQDIFECTSRMDVLREYYGSWFTTKHPEKGQIGLVPKLGMAVAQLADRYAKEGLSYVDLLTQVANHGIIEHSDIFECPDDEGLG